MNKINRIIKNNQMLTVVLLAYLLLFIVKTPMGISSLKNSLYYFKEMLIIMPVIVLLTALLEAWVPKRVIEKNLGNGSGIKGSILSFLLGSISAGPIYAAFPVCLSLLKKGASISSIVILLSTWAVVKIPMLANEAKFLSPKFMIIRWILTTVSIFMIGFITSKFVKRDDILKLHEKDWDSSQTLSVNADYCIGCGLCVKISPNTFKMQNKKSVVIHTEFVNDATEKAIEICPAKAISGIINKNK
ncbi:MAG: permease [Eubacteriaceae bacterium]